MNFYEKRRDLVAELIRKRFGSEKGAYAKFGEKVKIAESTVSRWFSTPGSKGHRRIGEEVARHIEDKCDLPRGSLVMPELGLPLEKRSKASSQAPTGTLEASEPLIDADLLGDFSNLRSDVQSVIRDAARAAVRALVVGHTTANGGDQRRKKSTG